MLSRRQILSVLALSAGSTVTAKAVTDWNDVLTGSVDSCRSGNEIIKPKGLQKKSKVAITAPASPTSYWEMRHSLKSLKNLGLDLVVGDTIKKRQSKYKYLSAPDEERAEELMKYITDPEIDAIICGRGGYGVMRILPLLDFDLIAKNPKVIMGFSDITALLNAIYSLTGIVTFHGPVAASTFDQFTIEYMKKVVFKSEKFKPITVRNHTITTFVKGEAEGKLIGGNLSILASTLGTPYEIDTKDSILFIEEVSEDPYKIDRMLTQLSLADKLQEANGLIIGYFKGLNTRKPFYPGGSFTIKEVLEQLIPPLNKPTIIGVPIGHVKSKLTFPIGISCKLDATNKTITILDRAIT